MNLKIGHSLPTNFHRLCNRQKSGFLTDIASIWSVISHIYNSIHLYTLAPRTIYFINALIRYFSLSPLCIGFPWVTLHEVLTEYLQFRFLCKKDIDKCGYGKKGRKEVLSSLNRRNYKEMLVSSLEKTRLRLSTLDVWFHLRDLIGSGHIKTVHTPTGLLARISIDWYNTYGPSEHTHPFWATNASTVLFQ